MSIARAVPEFVPIGEAQPCRCPSSSINSSRPATPTPITIRCRWTRRCKRRPTSPSKRAIGSIRTLLTVSGVEGIRTRIRQAHAEGVCAWWRARESGGRCLFSLRKPSVRVFRGLSKYNLLWHLGFF